MKQKKMPRKLITDALNSKVTDLKLNYNCDQCDFKTYRSPELKIHKCKEHQQRPDYNNYWRTKRLGTGYQSYDKSVIFTQ